MMDMTPYPFTPPAPVPRARAIVPSPFEIVRTLMRNPLEMWGAPSYEDKVIHTRFLNERSLKLKVC